MSWVATAVGAAGIGLKAYDYFSTKSDQEEAQKRLDEASKVPLAEYTASPELMNYYQRNLSAVNNPQGFTGGEKAAFRQNMASNIATQAYNASRGSGGQFGRYINNALAPSLVAGENTFAAQDATLRRNQENTSMGRLAGAVTAIQNLKNQNVTMQNQRQLMTQQALGQAVLQDKSYNQASISSMGSDLLGAGLMMGIGGGTNPGTFSQLGGKIKNLFGSNDAGYYSGAPSGVGDVNSAVPVEFSGDPNMYMWGNPRR